MKLAAELPSLSEGSGEELCFAFIDDKLLVKVSSNEINIPVVSDLSVIGVKPLRKQYLGKVEGMPCYSMELASELPLEGMVFQGLRQLHGMLREDLFAAAGRAFQIMNWDRTHLYCGHCGTPTKTDGDKYAKVCPKCGLVSYPRISPAMIVAVVKDQRILLARNRHRPFKFYSVLAGFVEPGETLENCVRREVREEAGIEVKNISYFGSQPWPFPDSLMIAFTAEYDSGEIIIGEDEILDAGWFSVEELGQIQIPGKISIARSLIDWFIEKYK